MGSPDQRRLYLGVDVGTTGTKAMVIDDQGTPQGRGGATYDLDCPAPGHFLQDPWAWQDGVTAAVRAACAHVDRTDVVALSISAQGGTLVAIDERLEPLGPARSWLDRRATRSAATFERVFGAADFYRRTGWPIAPNNTAAQLLDLVDSEPESFANATCFCDTAAYLNGWLTGTPTIDANVAGITQLVDAHTGTWDDEILGLIGVSAHRLPQIAEPGTAIAPLTEQAAEMLGLRPGILVGAGAQDQYCAALGANAIADGDILLSTGTAWVLLAVAAAPYPDPRGAIGFGRHLVGDTWGHFGEVSNGGVSLEFARRLLNHNGHAPLALDDLDALLAETPPGADGVSFFPFFDGTSPYDGLESSRGSLLGLSLAHDHRHVVRAVVEGVALAMRALLDRYQAPIDRPAGAPVVVGGATRSRAWMQILANVLGEDLFVCREPDAACVGAAILAASAFGAIAGPGAGAATLAPPRVRISPIDQDVRAYAELLATFETSAHALSRLDAARSTPPSKDPQS